MITKSVLTFYLSVETIVTQLVRMIVSIASFGIGELAPLAAPLAPSFSIYLAMSQRLQMPQYISLIAAGTIEIVGMYSAKISVRCYRWNATKTKTEPRVPQFLSIGMTAIFYIVVLALSLTIELIPSLTALIFPAFTLISVSVYVNMAIDQNLRNLETSKAAEIELRQERNGLSADIRLAKRELSDLENAVRNAVGEMQNLTAKKAILEAEISAKKTANGGNAAQTSAFVPGDKAALQAAKSAKQQKIARRQDEVLRLLNDRKKPSEIAEVLKCSADTIRRDIKTLNGRVQ